MAKISSLLFIVALIAFLHVHEARHLAKLDKSIEKDLLKAKATVEKQLKAKKRNLEGLTSEVETLSKSEEMLKELGNAYTKDVDLAPYEKKLKAFRRAILFKKAPAQKKQSLSILQSILKDFGLNKRK